MTPAQKARLAGFDASLSQRGVAVTVQTANTNFPARALIESVTEKTRAQLQLADEPVTHIVHIKREALGQVDHKLVTEIGRGDSSHTYRVQRFYDDAQRPAILFICVLA